MAWLSGWSYRKEISITGQSGAGTNYQVKFDVGDSAGGDFHLEGHCTNFPQDIRITDDDGTTLLDHFVEDLTADPIVVHVKVNDDLGSNQDIRVYYGKSGETTASNGANTFYGADVGFDSSTGWTEVDPNSRMSITGGQLVLTNLQRNVVAYTYNAMSPTYNPLVFEFAYKYTSGSSSTPQIYVSDGIANSLYAQTNAMGVRLDNPAGNGLYFVTRAGGTTYSNLAHIFTATTIAQTWYFRSKLISGTSATFEAWLDDPTRSGAADYTSSLTTAPTVAMTHVYAISGYLDAQNYTSSGWVDNVLVRKYNSPEPAFSSAGSEETPPVAGNPYWYYQMLRRRN